MNTYGYQTDVSGLSRYFNGLAPEFQPGLRRHINSIHQPAHRRAAGRVCFGIQPLKVDDLRIVIENNPLVWTEAILQIRSIGRTT